METKAEKESEREKEKNFSLFLFLVSRFCSDVSAFVRIYPEGLLSSLLIQSSIIEKNHYLQTHINRDDSVIAIRTNVFNPVNVINNFNQLKKLCFSLVSIDLKKKTD